MAENSVLVETTRVSNSRSLRMSLPRRIADKLSIGPDDIVGFFLSEEGDIVIKKLN